MTGEEAIQKRDIIVTQFINELEVKTMAKDIEVYTLKEIEDLLHVTRRTLYNWIKGGKEG